MTTIERAMDPAAVPTVTVRGWLRLEGAAVFVAGLVVYGQLGAPWWLALPLLLLPDVSAAGYLAGPRIGALSYNVVHNWAFGLAVLGLGLAHRRRRDRRRRRRRDRPRRHGPGRRVRPQAADVVPGHASRPDRSGPGRPSVVEPLQVP
jgi:MYXO-CTERM domain-containing protein